MLSSTAGFQLEIPSSKPIKALLQWSRRARPVDESISPGKTSQGLPADQPNGLLSRLKPTSFNSKRAAAIGSNGFWNKRRDKLLSN